MNLENFIEQEIIPFKDDCYIILSPTSYHKMNPTCKRLLEKMNYVFTNQLNYKDLETIENESYKYIIGIGGGTAIDYAKYIATRLNVECVAIPSMLSTNVFATNKVAVVNESEKHTEQGILPVIIVLDVEYLKKSSVENIYGLVDVFSIFNALRDWKLAIEYHVTPMNTEIYTRAENLLTNSVDLANRIIDSKEIDYKKLFEIILQAGYITNDYGSGRPESGSEHIFASAMEVNQSIPHALAVSVGMFIMTYFNSKDMYIQNPSDVILFEEIPFKELKIIDRINNLDLSYDYIFEVLNSIKPRPDKFTLVDLIKVQEQDYEPLKQFLQKYGFVFREDKNGRFI